MGIQDRVVELDEISKILEDMEGSPLYKFRKQRGYKPVAGEGSPVADLMLIGEAPGEMEAKSGRPFVGNSGKFLDYLLNSIRMTRSEVFITNIVKDRPPENRDPSPNEISIYASLLLRQIEIIQPRVIATLGRYAMEFILSQFESDVSSEKISSLHGKPQPVRGPYGPVIIVPLYHPAAALHNQNLRKTLEEDFKVIKEILQKR